MSSRPKARKGGAGKRAACSQEPASPAPLSTLQPDILHQVLLFLPQSQRCARKAGLAPALLPQPALQPHGQPSTMRSVRPMHPTRLHPLAALPPPPLNSPPPYLPVSLTLLIPPASAGCTRGRCVAPGVRPRSLLPCGPTCTSACHGMTMRRRQKRLCRGCCRAWARWRRCTSTFKTWRRWVLAGFEWNCVERLCGPGGGAAHGHVGSQQWWSAPWA